MAYGNEAEAPLSTGNFSSHSVGDAALATVAGKEADQLVSLSEEEEHICDMATD